MPAKRKLTEAQRADIRARYAAGAVARELCDIYGVHHRTIYRIIHGPREPKPIVVDRRGTSGYSKYRETFNAAEVLRACNKYLEQQ